MLKIRSLSPKSKRYHKPFKGHLDPQACPFRQIPPQPGQIEPQRHAHDTHAVGTDTSVSDLLKG